MAQLVKNLLLIFLGISTGVVIVCIIRSTKSTDRFKEERLEKKIFERDIFSDMQAKIGCQYISDLPGKKRAVWHEIQRFSLSVYSKSQLEDFSHYVFNMSYADVQEALAKNIEPKAYF